MPGKVRTSPFPEGGGKVCNRAPRPLSLRGRNGSSCPRAAIGKRQPRRLGRADIHKWPLSNCHIYPYQG